MSGESSLASTLLKILKKSTEVCAFIYDPQEDRIMFANAGFFKLLKLDDSRKLDIRAHVSGEDYQWMASFAAIGGSRRIVFKTADGSKRLTTVFSYIIEYQGKKAKFITIIDETEIHVHQILYRALSNVNGAIVRALSVDELFETICEGLVRDVGFELVAVGEADPDTKQFRILHSAGLEQIKKDAKELEITVNEELITGKSSVGQSYRTDSILVVHNVQKDKKHEHIREFLTKHRISSMCTIPIKENGSVRYVFMICSTIPELFSPRFMNLLKEMQQDVEFAIDKMIREKERALFFEAFEKSPAWIVMTDANGNIVHVNDTVIKTTGYSKEELLGKNPRIFKSNEHPEEFYKDLWDTITSGRVFKAQLTNKRKDGSLLYLDSMIMPIKHGNEVYRYVNISRDISEEIIQRKRIEKLSNLYKTLYRIGELLLEGLEKERLLERLPSVLLENSYFDLCVYIQKGKEGLRIGPYACRDNSLSGFVEFAKGMSNSLPEDCDFLFLKALRSGSIKMRDISKPEVMNSYSHPVKEELMKTGFSFILAIPLKEEKDVIGTLVLYSRYKGFMDTDSYRMFIEIQHLVSDYLTRLKREKWHNILTKAIDIGEDGICIMDSQFKIMYANSAIQKISGYSEEEIIGQSYKAILARSHDESFVNELLDRLKKLKGGESFSGIIDCKTKRGSSRKLIVTIMPYTSGEGKIEYYISTAKDITDQQKLQESLERILTHDSLTGLINRREFLKRVSFSIEHLRHKNHFGAVCVLNPIGLKHVNQAFGFETGDELLKSIAKRIISATKSYDIAAKLESDRFAVFLSELHSEEDALLVVLRLVDRLSGKYRPFDHEINLFFNAGVSIFPTDGKTAESLLEKAEIAVADAKSKGKNGIGFYKERLRLEAEKRVVLKTQIADALRKGEFLIYYQPYFDIDTLKVSGAEALIRWSKNGRIVPPMEFIPYLEELGMISDIEEWTTSHVPEQMKRWQEKGIPVVPISVNISPLSFKNSDFIESIDQRLDGLDPSLINVEIIERLFLDDVEYAKRVLKTLKSKGIGVYMDDFGTGYSSLSYLSSLPIDCIKIDISFVRKMVDDANTRAIVKTIISLAKELKVKTIAEGVETESQLKMLRKFGCECVQGYLFAPPLPSRRFLELLKSPNPSFPFK